MIKESIIKQHINFDYDLKKFNKLQRLQLILHYERLGYRYKKVTVGFWIQICAYLLKEFEFKQIFKSTRKFLKYIKKNV